MLSRMDARWGSGRRPLIAYPDGADSARTRPADVAALVGLGPEVDVLLGWTPEDRPWLADPTLRGHTVMAGYRLGRAVADGRLVSLPVRLSGVPTIIETMRPDVAVVSGVHRGTELAFRGTVGWGPAAARVARNVVVEVD